MTTDRVDIDVQSAALEHKLDELESAASAARPLLRSIGRSVVTRINLGFKAGRSPHGSKWAPLKFRDGQPLRDTRALQSSIVANVAGEHVDIGTNKVQARLQHFGGVVVPVRAKRLAFRNKLTGGMVFARRVRIPARPFMPVSASGQIDLPASWQDGMLAIIKRHLEGGPAPKDGA